MAPSVPKQRSPSMPQAMQGEIFNNVGKYARGAVLFAFQEMGGPEALATWAEANPDEFYTKLFTKIVAKESEVKHTRTIDDLMDALDGNYEVVDDHGEVIDTPVMDTAAGPGRWEPPQVEVDYEPVYTDGDVDPLEFVEFPDD